MNRTIVSTDDEEIAKFAKKYGAEVPFLRPSELSGDEVSLIPVVRHAMRYLEKSEGWIADIVVSIQPSSPLLESRDIDMAINKLIKTKCDSVISVCRVVRGHPFWALRMQGDRVMPVYPKGFRFLQRQDLPSFYMMNGALYARRRELLEKWNGKDFALGNDVRAIIMDEFKSIDINTPLDLLLAKAIMGTKYTWLATTKQARL